MVYLRASVFVVKVSPIGWFTRISNNGKTNKFLLSDKTFTLKGIFDINEILLYYKNQ
jgi:hypothetical protein